MHDERLANSRPRRRLFKRGDLRLLILELVQEHPRHGYDVIRALEDRFGGAHAPSPGTIYPTLEILADLGLVVGADDQGRRVFTITCAGQELLQKQEPEIAGIRRRLDDWWAPGIREQLRGVHDELREIHLALARNGDHVGWEALDQIRAIVVNTRREIERLLENTSEASPAPGSRASPSEPEERH